MKTRLEQVLERYLNGREIAIWGTPTRYLLRVLKNYNFSIADVVDPIKHYVVAVTNDDLDDFLEDEQSEGFAVFEDYTDFNDENELPFEWECCGAAVIARYYLRHPSYLEAFEQELREKGLHENKCTAWKRYHVSTCAYIFPACVIRRAYGYHQNNKI